MRARHLVLPTVFLLLLWGLAGAAPPPTEPQAFAAANAFFEEHSYLPAMQAFAEYLQAYPAGPHRDEASYKRCECLVKLRRLGDAQSELLGFLGSAAEGVWKARATVLMAENVAQFSQTPGQPYRDRRLDALSWWAKAIPHLSGEDLQHALLVRGRLYGEMIYQDPANHTLAEADWHRVAALDPHGEIGAEALLDLGNMQMQNYAANFSRPGQKRLTPREAQDAAIGTWRRLVANMPHSRVAARAQFSVADTLSGREDFKEALDAYQKVLDDYASTEQAKQARERRAEILEPRLEVAVERVFRPGEKFDINVRTRNMGKADFAAYKVDLLAQLQQTRDLQAVAGSLKPQGDAAAHWSHETGDKGEHKWSQAKVEVPLQGSGAYVLVGEGANKRTATLLLVTKLAVVTKWGRGRGLVYVADALDGKPVDGAELLVASQWKTDPNTNHPYFHSLENGRTDSGGTYDLALADKDGYSYSALVVARRGDDVALSTSEYYWYGYYNANGKDRYSVYFYTERPVYRPQQKVYWKSMVRVIQDEKYLVRPGEQFHVLVNTPRGEKLTEGDFRASEYGTLSGEFDLPPGAALGSYNVMIKHGDDNLAYFQFRVEEYKKPEFQVTVHPDKPRYRIGDKVAMTIGGKYYFGEPVAGGQVTYTVTRQRYYPWYFRYREYPWFIDEDRFGGNPFSRQSRFGVDGMGAYPNRYYTQQETVASGSAVLDKNGQLRLAFPVKAGGPQDQPETGTAWTYQLAAHVTDQSRRQIDGGGSFRATEKPFFLFVNPERYMYTPNDSVKLQVHAQDVDGNPVKTQAEVVVEKVDLVTSNPPLISQPRPNAGAVPVNPTQPLPPTPPTPKWREVHRGKLSIGDSGEATYTWSANAAGYYRVRLTADQTVVGSTAVQVGADSGGFYKFSGVQVMTDKELYRRGDHATLMLNTQFEGMDVLVTFEAEHIARRMVVHCASKSTLVSVPIGEDLEPNVWVHAVAVRDFKLLQDDKQIMVPPLEKILNVKVHPLQETFKPGEKGTVEIQVTDQSGLPVLAEVSVGVTDASVYYIQAETAPPIQKHFYGDKRQRVVTTTTSFDFRFQGVEREAAKDVRFRAAGAPAPAASAANEPHMYKEKKADREDYNKAVGSNLTLGGNVEPVIREYFPDTALWVAQGKTDNSGMLRVEVPFPDSLTTWRATVRAVGSDTRVGDATSDVITKKNLMVRLQSPRFFVENDEVVLSANVHNLLPTDQTVKVQLEAPGLKMLGASTESVRVKKGEQQRVDFRVLVLPPGIGKGTDKYTKVPVTVKALTGQESDAMRLSIPVLPHGANRYIAAAGELAAAPHLVPQVRGQGPPRAELPPASGHGKSTGGTAAPPPTSSTVSTTFTLHIPEARRKSSTLLGITVSPSLAASLVTALDYLVDYPYGCVEQTMSRFVPAAVVAKTIKDLGLSDPALEQKLPTVMQAGLERLESFQHSDGGWGWWHNDSTDPYMTAYVIYGLSLAKRAGVPIDEAVLARGVGFLKGHLKELETDRNRLAYAFYALSWTNQAPAVYLKGLFAVRDDLNDYAKFLLVIALHNSGQTQNAQVLLRNLRDFVRQDQDNQTASWAGDGPAYFWWQDGVETTATALQAHLLVDPNSDLVPQMVRWLVYNRRGNRWKSTRDSALAVLALSEYLKATHEQRADFSYDVLINGSVAKTGRISAQSLFSPDNTLLLGGDEVPSGDVKITIRRSGSGIAYYSAFASFFSREEGIPAGGNEVLVKRTYYRVHDGSDKKELLADGAHLTSGDLIEVDLDIEAKNNYEYLMFEDKKPAGCEPLALQSGSTYGDGFCADVELRDEMVAFFVGSLQQGKHHVAYRLRAEVPGAFHAMPTEASAMYVPEVRSNSAEFRLNIQDQPQREAKP